MKPKGGVVFSLINILNNGLYNNLSYCDVLVVKFLLSITVSFSSFRSNEDVLGQTSPFRDDSRVCDSALWH